MKIRVNLSHWTVAITPSPTTLAEVVTNLDGSLNFEKKDTSLGVHTFLTVPRGGI